jgi:hypothetical protein
MLSLRLRCGGKKIANLTIPSPLGDCVVISERLHVKTFLDHCVEKDELESTFMKDKSRSISPLGSLHSFTQGSISSHDRHSISRKLLNQA